MAKNDIDKYRAKKGPATAPLGELAAEKLRDAMLAKTNGGSAKAPAANAMPTAKKPIGSFKAAIRKRTQPQSTTQETLEEVSALVSRGKDADEFFGNLPSFVVDVCETQQNARDEIRAQLKDGAEGTAKKNLYHRREQMDEVLGRYVNADPALFDGGNDLTDLERDIATKVSRVAYVAWAIQNCPPRFGAVNWLVNDERNGFSAVALGVLAKAGENDKPFAWVGKKPNAAKYVLNPEYVPADAIVRKNWEAATGKPYQGIVYALIALSKRAKEEGEAFSAKLTDDLYDGANKDATVEDLIAEDGGEVMIVVTDPGEGEYRGGQIRVFRSDDDLVFPRAGKGGNHHQVVKLMENGTSIPVEALRTDTWKGNDSDEWLLQKILRRAVKNELARLAKRREGEKNLAEDTVKVEAGAKAMSAKENTPVLSLSDFHGGADGLTVMPYTGKWLKNPKEHRVGWWNPVVVVQRKTVKGEKKIALRLANDSGAKMFEELGCPMGGEFPEASTDPKYSSLQYSGVGNTGLRKYLQASYYHVVGRPKVAEASAEAAAPEETVAVEQPKKGGKKAKAKEATA